MKKLFTIIAVASMMLTTVGFTSCQKDELPAPAPQQTYVNNSGSTTTPTTNTQAATTTTTTTPEATTPAASDANYRAYEVFLNDEALMTADLEVTAEYDGQTKTYKVSEGQSATIDFSAYKAVKATGITTYSGKLLIIPAIKSTGNVTFKVSAIANGTPADSTVNVLLAYGYAKGNSAGLSIDLSQDLSSGEIHTEAFANKALNAAKFNDYLAARAKNIGHTL